jgi:hypothetical protein
VYALKKTDEATQRSDRSERYTYLGS